MTESNAIILTALANLEKQLSDVTIGQSAQLSLIEDEMLVLRKEVKKSTIATLHMERTFEHDTLVTLYKNVNKESMQDLYDKIVENLQDRSQRENQVLRQMSQNCEELQNSILKSSEEIDKIKSNAIETSKHIVDLEKLSTNYKWAAIFFIAFSAMFMSLFFAVIYVVKDFL